MTHVVTDACVNCKHTDCATVCPVDDCFLEGPNFLTINPETCIDCGVCIPECPEKAIYPDHEDRPNMDFWIKKNAELAEKWKEHSITEKKAPMPDYEKWEGVDDRRELIEEY